MTDVLLFRAARFERDPEGLLAGYAPAPSFRGALARTIDGEAAMGLERMATLAHTHASTCALIALAASLRAPWSPLARQPRTALWMVARG